MAKAQEKKAPVMKLVQKIKEKKTLAKKPNLFLKVMFGNFLILLLFFGFMFSAWVIHGFSYKDKKYFTSKSSNPQVIAPYRGDDFYESCPIQFWHCSPSQFSPSRNGWDTWCSCYKPNIGTYLLAPGFIYGESKCGGQQPVVERVTFLYWVLQALYAYVATGIIVYLFRRKWGK